MIELNEKETMTLKRLMAQGLSKGEALVKMGKAVRKVEVVKSTDKKTTTRKPREVDPTKAWVIDFVAIPLGGAEEVENLTKESGKAIHFEIDGESYSLTLTKHKKKV